MRRTTWVRCGHPMLPWAPISNLYGRDDALSKVRAVALKEMENKSYQYARGEWSAVYASGRSGSGKTEIGKQLPRLLSASCAESSTLKPESIQMLAKSAYLLIDCNGGGDEFESKYYNPLIPAHRMGWRLLAAVCRGSIGIRGVAQLREIFLNGGHQEIAKQLMEKGFEKISSVVGGTTNLQRALSAEVVLDALAQDLRENSAQRVAIFVHVDEHQFLYFPPRQLSWRN